MSFVSALIISSVFTAGLLSRRSWPRFTLEEFPSATRAGVAVVALILILAVTVFLPILTFRRGGESDLDDISYATLFLGHALLGGFLVLWWGLSGFPPLGAFLRFRFTGFLRYLRLGVGAGLVGWAITITVMMIAGSFVGLLRPAADPSADVPEVVRSMVDLSLAKRLGLIFSAMVVEECFFRAFLQTRCGLVLSSLLFTAGHSTYGLPLMLVGVFSVSIVLGLLYRSTKNVVPCMIAHGVFDGVQLLVILPLVANSS